MSRRSIILQELEENEKKLNAYNQAVQGYNANVESRNANYNAQVANYNAWLDQVRAGADRGYFKVADGSWQYATGVNGDITPIAPAGKRTAPLSFHGIYNSVDEAKATRMDAGYYLVRNKDGSATPYQATSSPSEPTPVHVPLSTNYAATARIGEFNVPAPTAPATPEQPEFYTMSRREQVELNNPMQTGAQATLAENRGMPAKTELANQKSTGLAGAQDTSAFAERDREESIKQSGILARVLAGQLA